MATMNVSMPKEMAEFVEREVASGEYSSSSEVVREALRLLRHDKAQEEEKLAILRREIGIAIDDVAAGRISKKSVRDIMEEVLNETSGE
ncbi:type II toxin-antitoxin system ParD family antitoxin [Corticibacterium sp. UT-5YL-CI-8]|nr:type II toxin-antitoxin system ParD family antitoxin [Tianweitania sp. UT-5YL-CI-8]